MRNIVNHPGNAELYSLENVHLRKKSPLKGKKAIYLGSSVTLGFGSLNESFADFLRAKDGVEILVKEAVNGTTLVTLDEKSYIPRMLTIDRNLQPDVFVCQLSTNDATRNLPMGKISSNTSYSTDYISEVEKAEAETSEIEKASSLYNQKTIIGAIEYIISYAQNTWNCPVVFYTGTHYESQAYGLMVEALLQLKEKWNITVIDQWNDEELNDISPLWRDLYMLDPIHPTKAGYLQWWLPQFEEGLMKALNSGDDVEMKFNPLIPELTVADIERTKRFYLDILNFKLEYERPEDRFIFISKEGNQMMLQEENGVWDVGKMEYPFGRGINFEMTVSDIEHLYEKVRLAGIGLFRDIKISHYRKDDSSITQKEFLVQDPDGYLLRFTN